MLARSLLASAFSLFLLYSVPAAALPLYDTFQFGQDPGSLSRLVGTSPTPITNQPALSFVSPASVALESITFRARVSSGTTSFAVRLYDDASGLPGTLLEEIIASIPSVFTDVTVVSVLAPVLTSGQQFWVSLAGVDDTTFGTWAFADTVQDNRAVAFSNSPNPTWLSTSAANPGLVTVTGVPEPGTLLLVAMGTIALAIRRQRRMRPERA